MLIFFQILTTQWLLGNVVTQLDCNFNNFSLVVWGGLFTNTSERVLIFFADKVFNISCRHSESIPGNELRNPGYPL